MALGAPQVSYSYCSFGIDSHEAVSIEGRTCVVLWSWQCPAHYLQYLGRLRGLSPCSNASGSGGHALKVTWLHDGLGNRVWDFASSRSASSIAHPAGMPRRVRGCLQD